MATETVLIIRSMRISSQGGHRTLAKQSYKELNQKGYGDAKNETGTSITETEIVH